MPKPTISKQYYNKKSWIHPSKLPKHNLSKNQTYKNGITDHTMNIKRNWQCNYSVTIKSSMNCTLHWISPSKWVSNYKTMQNCIGVIHKSFWGVMEIWPHIGNDMEYITWCWSHPLFWSLQYGVKHPQEIIGCRSL